VWLRECLAARPPCHHVLLEHLLRSGCPRPGQGPSLPPSASLHALRTPLQAPRGHAVPPPIRPHMGAPLLHDRAVACLFRALDPERLLYLFTALLCERRVVFTSARLTHLSQCVHAAEALLWPFRWQQVFVPLLPESMMNYCAAPMPFLIGLPSALLPQLEALPLEKLIVVSLDDNRTGAFQEDVDLVPARLLNKLKQRLDQCASAAVAGSVALCFREFFLALFLRYRGFFAPIAGGLRFDHEAFIAQQAKDMRPFLRAFCGSQMFERWIAEREHELEQGHPSRDHFHRELDAYVDDSASYQSYSVKLQNATNKLLGSVMSKYKRAKEKYTGADANLSSSAAASSASLPSASSASASRSTIQRRGSSSALADVRRCQQPSESPSQRHVASVSSGQQRTPRPQPARHGHPAPRSLPSQSGKARPTRAAGTPPPRKQSSTPEELYRRQQQEYRARHRSQQPVRRALSPAAERVSCTRQDVVMQAAVTDPIDRISFSRLHCSLAPGRAASANALFEGDAPSEEARRTLLAQREADRVQRQRNLAAQLGSGASGSSRARRSGSSGVPHSSPIMRVPSPAAPGAVRGALAHPHATTTIVTTAAATAPPRAPPSHTTVAVTAPTPPLHVTRAAPHPPAHSSAVILQRPEVVHVVAPARIADASATPSPTLLSFAEVSSARTAPPTVAYPSPSLAPSPSASLSQGSASASPVILIPQASAVNGTSGGFLFTPPDMAPASFAPPPSSSAVHSASSSSSSACSSSSSSGDSFIGQPGDILLPLVAGIGGAAAQDTLPSQAHPRANALHPQPHNQWSLH
jgi:DENN (AEX-3) domain/dDENN domain